MNLTTYWSTAVRFPMAATEPMNQTQKQTLSNDESRSAPELRGTEARSRTVDESRFDGVLLTEPDSPFRPPPATRSTTAVTIGGPLDPAAPRALWRLIQIGETAGLVTPADQEAITEAFGRTARRASIDRALAHARCGVTELYVLVTLFAAEPRPVGRQTLAHETLADSGSLRLALERLEALAAISPGAGSAGEPPVMLTSSGRGLAAILVYRVLRLAVSLRPEQDERAETMPAEHRRRFHPASATPGASAPDDSTKTHATTNQP